MSYSKFMSGLKKAGVDINRKMLSEIAIMDEKAFKALVETSKKGLTEKVVKAEVKVEKEVKEVKANSDLESKTLKELKELAKEKNVEGYSTMKKAELLEALK